jgi:hypothetical protein
MVYFIIEKPEKTGADYVKVNLFVQGNQRVEMRDKKEI